jgi:hypothetical protein
MKAPMMTIAEACRRFARRTYDRRLGHALENPRFDQKIHAGIADAGNQSYALFWLILIPCSSKERMKIGTPALIGPSATKATNDFD